MWVSTPLKFFKFSSFENHLKSIRFDLIVFILAEAAAGGGPGGGASVPSGGGGNDIGLGIGIEMLKALYDFQAVYPKTISFDEGEYFILYQTSARQRNWWQVVSMKGNIGFVPSNYVMKIKVEYIAH